MTDYQDFLQAVVQGQGDAASVASLYHLVRRIPYGGAGQRDPRKVYEANIGTCSGKHILLRDLLRAAGYPAEVITIFTHFNKGIPVHDTMPEELRRIILERDVPDYHHFVRVQAGVGEVCDLDATWHDALIPFGFPVNHRWAGRGSTRLAGAVLESCSPCEDIVSLKQELLTGLREPELRLRARFLGLLSDWFRTIE